MVELLNMGICHPPSPKPNLSTSPASLPTTTSAQGFILIQKSISCVRISKALQNHPPSTKSRGATRKKGLCGIRRVINNVSECLWNLTRNEEGFLIEKSIKSFQSLLFEAVSRIYLTLGSWFLPCALSSSSILSSLPLEHFFLQIVE